MANAVLIPIVLPFMTSFDKFDQDITWLLNSEHCTKKPGMFAKPSTGFEVLCKHLDLISKKYFLQKVVICQKILLRCILFYYYPDLWY